MIHLNDVGRQEEDESEAGLSNFEQRKEAWRSEQDALNFPDEVGAVPCACSTQASMQPLLAIKA